MFLLSDAPRVELILGASISPDSVYEGGDVYFDCRIQSRPPPKKIIWQFDVSQIPHPTDRPRPTVCPSLYGESTLESTWQGSEIPKWNNAIGSFQCHSPLGSLTIDLCHFFRFPVLNKAACGGKDGSEKERKKSRVVGFGAEESSEGESAPPRRLY